MKMIALFILLASTLAFSQIPNGDFETWNSDGPSGWATPNAPMLPQLVTQSPNAKTGSFAVKGEVVQWSPGLVVAPFIQSGDDASGFPYTQRPVKFTGNYILNPVGSDRLSVSVLLMKNGELVGIAARTYSTATQNYLPLEVPFQYMNDDTPDTCVVTISIIGPVAGSDYHLGTSFLVDDLKFSDSPVSVEEELNNPKAFSLMQNYPNPFNPSTVIRFNLQTSGMVELGIFNAAGEKVAELVNGQMESGNHEISFNAQNLPSGTYFYRLTSGNITETKKMLLIK